MILRTSFDIWLQVGLHVLEFVFIFGVVWLVMYFRRKRWKKVADELGLGMYRGTGFEQPQIKGYFHDILVTLTPVKNRRRKGAALRIDALLPVSLPTGLQLSREDFFFRLGKKFGGEEIELGDAAFDHAFKIRGEDLYGIRHLLTNAGVRNGLLAFIARHVDTAIDATMITIDLPQRLPDAAKTREILLEVVNLARLLASAQGMNLPPVPSPPPVPNAKPQSNRQGGSQTAS